MNSRLKFIFNMFIASQFYLRLGNSQSYENKNMYVGEDISHSHFNKYGSPISLSTTQRKNLQSGLAYGQTHLFGDNRTNNENQKSLNLGSVYSIDDARKLQVSLDSTKIKATDDTAFIPDNTDSTFRFNLNYAYNLGDRHVLGAKFYKKSFNDQNYDWQGAYTLTTVKRITSVLEFSYGLKFSDNNTVALGVSYNKKSDGAGSEMEFPEYFLGFAKKFSETLVSEFNLEYHGHKEKPFDEARMTILTNKTIYQIDSWQIKNRIGQGTFKDATDHSTVSMIAPEIEYDFKPWYLGAEFIHSQVRYYSSNYGSHYENNRGTIFSGRRDEKFDLKFSFNYGELKTDLAPSTIRNRKDKAPIFALDFVYNI